MRGGRFQGRRIDSGYPRWAFCPAKHGWKYFLTLTSFPAQIRDFKNLKGIWHQMLARSCQLQVIFGFLKPLFHVQILDWSWSVDKNDGVVRLHTWKGDFGTGEERTKSCLSSARFLLNLDVNLDFSTNIFPLTWSHLVLYQVPLYLKTNLPVCLFTHPKG